MSNTVSETKTAESPEPGFSADEAAFFHAGEGIENGALSIADEPAEARPPLARWTRDPRALLGGCLALVALGVLAATLHHPSTVQAAVGPRAATSRPSDAPGRQPSPEPLALLNERRAATRPASRNRAPDRRRTPPHRSSAATNRRVHRTPPPRAHR